MRMLLELPPHIINDIQKLVNSGQYDSLQQFALGAIQNQLYLEESQLEDNLLLQKARPDLMSSHFFSGSESRVLTALPPEDVSCVSPSGTSFSSDQPIFGQYNRLFPVKITLRVLANTIASEGSKWVALEKVQEDATNFARFLGHELRIRDKKANRKRGFQISTALPIGARDELEAMNRFKSQFVGCITKAGRVYGAPAALKFAAIRDSQDPVIGITPQGLQFARIRNPILDESGYDQSLSSEESDFLIKHIHENLESEANAIRSILIALSGGYLSPAELDRKLAEATPNVDITRVSTLRIGLLGRLFEMGLVRREKRGVEVRYSITPQSRQTVSILAGEGA